VFCSNCGIQLPAGVNFCPNCGTRVTAPATAANKGNMVMLVSLGDSNRATAAALLMRICGYTDEEALLIVDNAPITVARSLNDAQARYLAQALAEYGIEVSVYDGSGWREWESDATSVWDRSGSLLAGVASALGLLGIGNRITRDMMRRTDYPYRTTGARPPVFRVNSALRAAPRPPVHRAPPPPQPPRPAPQPARPVPQPPRPAPQPPRPAPQPPRPAPQPARPAPQPARPAPQPARPAPQSARPAPQPARPAPQSARPIPQPARPAPQPGRPAPQPAPRPAARPGDLPGRGNPGGRPGGGTGRRG